MPFGTVTRLRDALAPGGRLLVLGCYAGITPWDVVASPANAVARVAVHLADRAARPDCSPARTAGPGAGDDAARRSGRRRPGCSRAAKVRQLLYWRYLLTYERPDSPPTVDI
ncbi:hypothetical protein [Streptomyces sp. KL116D]|uniref:hypothetical protein n=1 Tax=Streptomyces sp. KL116D TaxID=3045152 RepID=UPI003557CD32